MTIQNWNSLVRKQRVFIVHGHDPANLQALTRLINHRFKLNAVVLNQLPDQGRAIIEKFEQEAEQCCYAIVLMTPDDCVKGDAVEFVWQPRGNVMFELGWFCARLGRRKVLFLSRDGVQLPSDFAAVVQKRFKKSIREKAIIRGLEVEFQAHGIIPTKASTKPPNRRLQPAKVHRQPAHKAKRS